MPHPGESGRSFMMNSNKLSLCILHKSTILCCLTTVPPLVLPRQIGDVPSHRYIITLARSAHDAAFSLVILDLSNLAYHDTCNETLPGQLRGETDPISLTDNDEQPIRIVAFISATPATVCFMQGAALYR